jgi:hypothetical protein
MNQAPPKFWELVAKTVVTHTVTYFFVGLLAFVWLDYARKFTETDLQLLMRQTGDPMVMAGPLFQPIRGFLFGIVLYPLREALFNKKRGWLVLWGVLVAVGVLGAFGPAPGSLEGMIYTKLSWRTQLEVLPEIVLQPLLLSAILCYWVRHPTRWINWCLGILFFLVLLFPILGLLARPPVAS